MTSFEKTNINLSAANSTHKSTPLRITITQQGKYFVGEKEVIDNSPESLFRALSHALDEIGEAFPPIVISADANTSYQNVVTAMEIAGKIGLSDMSLETTERDK